MCELIRSMTAMKMTTTTSVSWKHSRLKILYVIIWWIEPKEKKKSFHLFKQHQNTNAFQYRRLFFVFDSKIPPRRKTLAAHTRNCFFYFVEFVFFGNTQNRRHCTMFEYSLFIFPMNYCLCDMRSIKIIALKRWKDERSSWVRLSKMCSLFGSHQLSGRGKEAKGEFTQRFFQRIEATWRQDRTAQTTLRQIVLTWLA